MTPSSNNLTVEHLKVAARQLQEAEITIDEFLELVQEFIATAQSQLLSELMAHKQHLIFSDGKRKEAVPVSVIQEYMQPNPKERK